MSLILKDVELFLLSLHISDLIDQKESKEIFQFYSCADFTKCLVALEQSLKIPMHHIIETQSIAEILHFYQENLGRKLSEKVDKEEILLVCFCFYIFYQVFIILLFSYYPWVYFRISYLLVLFVSKFLFRITLQGLQRRMS